MVRAHFIPDDVAAAPPNFEWNYEVTRAILYPLEHENVRLGTALGRINQRAAMALAAGIGEWIARRMEGRGDTADALFRVEAAYAAAVQPDAVAMTRWPTDYPEEPSTVYGPLEVAGMILTDAFQAIAADDAGVNTNAVAMAVLAMHVLPRPDVFEEWLSSVLRHLAARHPNESRLPREQSAVGRDELDPGLFASLPGTVTLVLGGDNPYAVAQA